MALCGSVTRGGLLLSAQTHTRISAKTRMYSRDKHAERMWRLDAWQDGPHESHPVLLGPHFFWGRSTWTLLLAATFMGLYLAVRVAVWAVWACVCA